MSAYMIIAIDFDSEAVLTQYAQMAMPTLEQFDVSLVAATSTLELLDGSWPRKRIAVLEFADLASVHAFFESPDYAAAKAFREANSSADIIAVEGQPCSAADGAHFVLGRSTSLNEDWQADYMAGVGPMAERFGVQGLAMGQAFETLEGTWGHESMVFLRLPSTDAYREFWHGEEYAPLKALREANTECDHIAFAGGFQP